MDITCAESTITKPPTVNQINL